MIVRASVLVSYLALLGLQVLWHGVLAPTHPAILALAVLPLLVPLPWLIRRHAPRATLLAAYLSLFYFVHGVTEALVSPPWRALALVETGLCLWLCAAAVLRYKYRSG